MKTEHTLAIRPQYSANPSINRPKINSVAFATYSVLVFLGHCAVATAQDNSTDFGNYKPFSFKSCKEGVTAPDCMSDIGGTALIGIGAITVAVCATLMALFAFKRVQRIPEERLEAQREQDFIERAQNNPNLYYDVLEEINAPIEPVEPLRLEHSIEAHLALERLPLIANRPNISYL